MEFIIYYGMSEFDKKLKRLLDTDDGKTRHPKRAKLVKAARSANWAKRWKIQVSEQLSDASACRFVSEQGHDVDLPASSQQDGKS